MGLPQDQGRAAQARHHGLRHHHRKRAAAGRSGAGPRRIGPTWSQFLRPQALAILAPGGPQGSDQEDRDRQGQAPTPAPDSGDRLSLQKKWSPGDALAASAPVGVSGRGWELPSEVRQNRPVRMLAARSFPLGCARPRDGPAPARLPLADSRDPRDPAGSGVRTAPEPGAASLSAPFEPRPATFAGNGSMLRLGPELEVAA